MTRPTTRAFTLIELVISSTVLSLVITLAMGLFLDSSSTVGDSLAITEAAQRANDGEKLVSGELEGANVALLFVQDDENHVPGHTYFTAIRYTKPTGYDVANGVATLGDVYEIRFVYDAGENPGDDAGDDVDNDGDGLIDEGRLELWVDTNADGEADTRLRVIARDVASDEESYSNGNRGLKPRFVLESASDTPTASDQYIKCEFGVLRRLPRDGAVHCEDREVRQALRNQG